MAREPDASSQIAIIENLISRDYGAVIIAPNDSQQLVPITQKALAHGTKVVIVDNALDTELLGNTGATIPFIGSDNFAGAKMVGEYMRTRLGSKGRVIIIEGMPGVSNSDKRKRGFIEGLLGRGSEIEIAGVGRGNWHMDEAFSSTVRLLEKDNNIDAVFCTNDVMAMGAIQALEMYNLAGKVFVAGYDNIDLARIAMKTGHMHATVEQYAEFMGRYSVEIAWKAMNNMKTDQVRYTPLELVTAEHVGKRILVSLPEVGGNGDIFLSDLRKEADILGMEVIFLPEKSRTEGENLQEYQERLQGVDMLLTVQEDDPLKELALERNVPVLKIDYAATGDAGKAAAKAAAISFRKP